MCLAVPGQLLEIIGDDPLTRSGLVAFAGVEKQASLALLPDAVVGDYILVHAGFAIATVNAENAQRSLDYLDALGVMESASVSGS